MQECFSLFFLALQYKSNEYVNNFVELHYSTYNNTFTCVSIYIRAIYKSKVTLYDIITN